MREVLYAIFAIFYVLTTGCQWWALPSRLPLKNAAHFYFQLWDWDGTLERIDEAPYVDMLGLLLGLSILPVNIQDRDGAPDLLRRVRAVFSFHRADIRRRKWRRRSPPRDAGRSRSSNAPISIASSPCRSAADYRKVLGAAGMIQSMSRKGNCWDNAPMESCFGTLKTELVHQACYPTRDAARHDLFAYIEGYYNRQRLHSALGYITPEQAERQAA